MDLSFQRIRKIFSQEEKPDYSSGFQQELALMLLDLGGIYTPCTISAVKCGYEGIVITRTSFPGESDVPAGWPKSTDAPTLEAALRLATLETCREKSMWLAKADVGGITEYRDSQPSWLTEEPVVYLADQQYPEVVLQKEWGRTLATNIFVEGGSVIIKEVLGIRPQYISEFLSCVAEQMTALGFTAESDHTSLKITGQPDMVIQAIIRLADKAKGEMVWTFE